MSADPSPARHKSGSPSSHLQFNPASFQLIKKDEKAANFPRRSPARSQPKIPAPSSEVEPSAVRLLQERIQAEPRQGKAAPELPKRQKSPLSSALLTLRCRSPTVPGFFGGRWEDPTVFPRWDMPQKSRIWGFAPSEGVHFHHTPTLTETPPPSEPGWSLPAPPRREKKKRIFRDLRFSKGRKCLPV